MVNLRKMAIFCCGVMYIISPLVRSVEISKQNKFLQWQDYRENICIDSNLVAYYDFEQGMENTLKNKAIGVRKDDSPAKWNGICKGAVLAAGRWPGKKALEFDGINDYVDCGNNWGIITGEITIEIWLKKKSTDSARIMGVVSKGGNGLYSPYTVSIDKGNSIYFLQQARPDGGWETSLFSQRVIADNKWHHIVVTNDLFTAKIYIDGILDYSENTRPAQSLNNNDVNLTIGAEINPSDKTIGRYFEGVIDEMAIYNRALTPKEIVSHYTIGNPYEKNASDTETPYILENVDFNANIIKNSGFEQTTGGDSLKIIPGWNINGYNTALNSAIVVTSQQKFEGQQALEINLKKGKYCFSIHQEIPEVITPNYYLLSLSYKTNGSIPLNLCFSSGPGGIPPQKVKKLFITSSDEWQQVTWPIKMFYRDSHKRYFEILINGEIENDARLYLDAIKLVPLMLKPKIRLFSPQSGNVFDNFDTDRLTFISTYPIDQENLHVSLVSKSNSISKPLSGKDINLTQEDKFTFHLAMPTELPLGEYLINMTDVGQKLNSQFEVRKRHLEQPYAIIHNGAPYVNGKPFLTIGIYHASDLPLNMVNDGTSWGNDSSPGNKAMGLPLLTYDQMLSSLSARGFNTVTWSSGVLPSEDFFKSTEKLGLMVLPMVSCDLENQNARHFKNLLFWSAHDEVSAPRKTMEKEYSTSRKIDPFRFVYGSTSSGRFGRSAGDIEDWSIFDIVSPDIYDIGGPQSDVDTTYNILCDAHKYIVKNDTRKCCFLIPQLFCARGPYVPSNAESYGWSNGFEPTYEQVRAQIYTGIVGGAKGFIYYSYVATEKLVDGMSGNTRRKHWFLPESKLWDKIGELNIELLALKDAILIGREDDSILISTEKVRCSVKKTTDKIYFIAVNPFATKETLTYKIKDSNLAFSPLFNADPLAGDEGTITMDKYEVGVWEAEK